MKYLGYMFLTLLLPLASQAGINIQWFVGYGIYPFGAADPTSFTAGTGLLANNGTGNTILQLVYSASNTRSDVDPFATDYVSGDNVVWQTRAVTDGVGGYDEWIYNSTLPTPFTSNTFSSGSVFVRVFQDASPQDTEYYYDSDLLTLEDRGSDLAFTQPLTVEPNPGVSGVALNRLIVPEPSVLAFVGLGGLLAVARRRLRK